MKINLRSILPAVVFVALAAMGWRQARLSDEVADLRREIASRPAIPAARQSPATAAVRAAANDRTGSPTPGESDVATLREEIEELRNVQASLQTRLATATRSGAIASGWARAATSRSAEDSGIDSGLETTWDFGPRAAESATAKGPSWSPQQLAGAPDTLQSADLPTAWASKLPDGGAEWLQLDYERAVDLAEVRVHESFNPGAISRVAAMQPDGRETTIWEGAMDPDDESVESVFGVPPGLHGSSIRIYLDTTRVTGWNEIDAVEVVGRDGTRQWATGAQASSFYGQDFGQVFTPVGIESLSGPAPR
jgi:hypothetical protein